MYGQVFFSEVFSPTNFSHKLTGIIQHCTFVHQIFTTNWWELSNTIRWSPNFSHKLTGIIQHYTLFTEFFPQTDMIFPTNQHDFPHKPTWIFPKKVLVGNQTYNPSRQLTPLYPLSHRVMCQSCRKKASQFGLVKIINIPRGGLAQEVAILNPGGNQWIE